MNSSLTPTQGARFLLEREPTTEPGGPATGGKDDGARAVYRAAIYTPDATYEARAILGDDGTVDLAATGVPDELLSSLQMLAKLTARSAAKKREDGLPPWPSRVMRWRGPGRGE